MSILIFGGSGQVGAHLVAQSGGTAIPRSACDLTTASEAQLAALLDHHQPPPLINAAAYTKVDDAEKQRELTETLNAIAPRRIAAAAASRNIKLLHLSTDYVFDGRHGPYREDDTTNPLNHYGASKLRGEQAVLELGATVFRIQWVFDVRGHNLFPGLRQLLGERAQLDMVADQWGAPSYAGHLATAILAARDVPAGLYHLAAAGFTSRHGFASAMAAAMGSKCHIRPITSPELPRPAQRPLDTRLDTAKLAALGVSMPHWREGLKEAFACASSTLTSPK